ncbi:MAG: YHS domain-containing protein [Candidatus Aminicenantes bacterium]|nr:MAG: YHS domain-containing protein [Candidatus Aminicenantes bacterium]
MMKNSKILVLLLGFTFLLTLTGIAQTQETEETVVCAVSGKEMKKSEAKATYEYKGKTYYFCCDNCKEAFIKNPKKYTQKKGHEGHMLAGHHAEETVVDPVCGMKIKKSDAKATYEHNGETYYFCMEGCKNKFKKDPDKYAKKAGEMVTCPVSGKKIKKSDAAGSHEYNGKTYYFCCANCKEKFTKNPEKYTQKNDEMKSCDHGCCAKEIK